MDREIPKEVRDKERKKKFIKYGAIGVAAVVCIAVLIRLCEVASIRKIWCFQK
mgnify:CR=1 FL=1